MTLNILLRNEKIKYSLIVVFYMSNRVLYSFCSYTYVIPNNQMYTAHSDYISSARTKIEFLHELIQLSQGLDITSM